MSVLEKALVKLARTLSENAIPYMIIGGMANAVWGEPRATLDIDATVWVRDEEIDKTVAWLHKVFRPLVSDPADFIRDTRVLPLESEGGIRIDLIFATLPYERQAIGRAVEIAVEAFPVLFCTPEDLILHKIISKRKRDQADARGVTLRQLKSLDLAYLDPRIRELAEALDRPEMWQSWEQWKEEAAKIKRGPRPPA
jgi:hypothetical protein